MTRPAIRQAGWFRARRFAGFTPYNAVDRADDYRRDHTRFMGYPRFCAYYGPMTWDTLYKALVTRFGQPYRAGDGGRRRR